MDDGDHVAAVADVPEQGTFLFTARRGDEETELILTRDGDDVRAWRNYCQHWTDVRLDKGEGATMRDGEIVCTRHGATFESDTGRCTFGPCEGAVLDAVDVTVVDGEVFLTDDDYEFVEVGATKADWDRSTSRGLGFQ